MAKPLIAFKNNIAYLPSGRPIAGLIRHAERGVIPPGEIGNELTLTENGERTCLALAEVLRDKLVGIYSSPVKRCMQTAQLLSASTDIVTIELSTLLGDPGIFISNRNKVHNYFLQNQLIAITQRLLSSQKNPDGFCASTEKTVNKLIYFLLQKATRVGISLFITHDSILSVVLGTFFKEVALEVIWPAYLDTMFLWQEQGILHILYRQHYKKIIWSI